MSVYPNNPKGFVMPPCAGENIPQQTGPNRMPQELFEIIQIPTGADPFIYENLWETELCDFFEDCNECNMKINFKKMAYLINNVFLVCFAHCCYYCYIYTIFRDMDENILSYIFTPNPLVLIRTKLRAVLRIKVNNNIYNFEFILNYNYIKKGSLLEDCCQTALCAPCSAFQIKQELKYKAIVSV
jgi:hypothetical protein